MSEIKKIGMYTTDEILEHLTEGEGRGFLGRSIYDAIYFRIEELETQLQQKENIIKEAREYIESYMPNYDFDKTNLIKLLEILDKENNDNV